uniref:Protein ecdysoneless homolog n=1 Tax=Dermatophagoides pteronyssinus TaxID=6956 RepID=A0A6P6XXN3_DERPT|nr:protein ecdysoneless homolog [Dermatophagoides pteronyssinus]
MSHRMKYSLEKKKIILNEYDYGNHTTKQIAEKYQMPLSTVLYFIRNRSKYEQRNNHHQDDQDDQDNIGVKRKRLDIDSICSSDDNDHQNQQQQQQPRIRKISNDMKSKIIKAWEERDQGGNDNGGGGGVGWSMRKIAEHFGVSTRSVSRCLAYQRRRNDLITSNNDNNSPDHHKIDDNEFDLDDDDDDDDDDDLIAIQSNSNFTDEHCIDEQRLLVGEHQSSTMISNSDHQNDENETIHRQWSSIKRSKSTIDPCDQKLDDELINSINEIFDHLKKLRNISKRLKSPLNRMVLKFSETILQQANSYNSI